MAAQWSKLLDSSMIFHLLFLEFFRYIISVALSMLFDNNDMLLILGHILN